VPVRLIILDNNSQKYNKNPFFRDKAPNILFALEFKTSFMLICFFCDKNERIIYVNRKMILYVT